MFRPNIYIYKLQTLNLGTRNSTASSVNNKKIAQPTAEYQEIIERKCAKELEDLIDALRKTINKFVLLNEPHALRITFPRNTVTPVLQLLCQSIPTRDHKEIKCELDKINSTTGNAILLQYGSRIAEYLNNLYKHLKLRIENIKNENAEIMVFYEGNLDFEKIWRSVKLYDEKICIAVLNTDT
ncbi:6443_t:CDS:2 [Ambispora leptoticha]|uniref:6443_t:CDS:1 n=1 Tax=Ambispora leptoticha TaxID=144679 RepID=A0A9N9FNI2_9GLOM|nr:6443_t:CDS:2 [Ambispora leptoticha]